MDIKQISPSFFVSPQVKPDDIPDLARAGFRGILNNRPDREEAHQPLGEEIARLACDAGLAYRHIPITPGQVQPHQAPELASFLNEVQGPVLGFCRTGARAEGLWKRLQEGGGDGR